MFFEGALALSQLTIQFQIFMSYLKCHLRMDSQAKQNTYSIYGTVLCKSFVFVQKNKK